MKKFKKKEIIALAVVAVLIIATVVVGIVLITGNVNEANTNATTATDETQVVTELTTDAEGNTVVVEVTQAEDEASAETTTPRKVYSGDTDQESTVASTKSNSSDNKTTTNNNSSKADDNSTSEDDDSFDNNTSGNTGEIEVVTPETKPVDKKEEILTINGTKCNVGNTITVTLNAKTPVVLENYQGFTEYDDTYLEFVSIKGNVSGMFNDHESAIYYNGSDIGAGYDFTNNGTLYTATFKVLKAGSTEITNTIEVMSDQNSKAVDQTQCEYSIGIFN